MPPRQKLPEAARIHHMTSMENVKMNDLMFKALDHGILSVSEGESLIPFVLTEQKIQRFMEGTLEESMRKAEEYLLTLKEESVVALAYDALLTIDGVKYEAVCVRAYAKDEEKGILLAQRYRPRKLLKRFAKIGNPTIVEYLPNILVKPIGSDSI